jgi:hypothetical protein
LIGNVVKGFDMKTGLRGIFVHGYVMMAGVLAAFAASSPMIQNNGLAEGQASGVLPQNALIHLQFSNPQRLLENIEKFAVATVPERLLPPDVQQLLETEHPLLTAVGQQTLQAPLTAEAIAEKTGLQSGEAITLTMYPGLPNRSFILSIPISDHERFEGLLRHLLNPQSVERTSLGSKEFVRIRAEGLPVPDLFVAGSANRVYVSGDQALLMRLYEDSGSPRLGESAYFSKVFSATSDYDLWLTMDPSLLRAFLPQLEAFKYLPLQKLVEQRAQFLSQVPQQQREAIEAQLASQWGIYSLEELADYLECVITASYEELFNLAMSGLKSFQGLSVAVRADAAFPQATVFLHSENSENTAGTASIPLDQVRAALQELPGQYEHFSVTGQQAEPQASARVLSWLNRIRSGLATKKLKTEFVEKIEKAYTETVRPAPLNSKVPWVIRTRTTVNPWPSLAEAESLTSYGRAIEEALPFPTSRKVSILPGQSDDFLAEDLRQQAEAFEKNRKLGLELFADLASPNPFIVQSCRVESRPLENSVTKVTWETSLSSRGGFFGFNQHELISRRFYYSRPVGDYFVFHQASRNPDWISRLAPHADCALQPAVAKLLERLPGDVSFLRIDRNLRNAPGLVTCLVDLEGLIHKDVQSYLKAARELASQTSDREELIQKLRRLKFSPLVYSVNQDPETKEIYCLLPGGIAFPRERVTPLIQPLFADFAERADQVGGLLLYSRSSEGTCETSLIQSTEAVSYLVKSVGNAFAEQYGSDPSRHQEIQHKLVTDRDQDPKRFEQILVKNPAWSFVRIQGGSEPPQPRSANLPAPVRHPIPPRDAHAPAELIDLTPHYNASIKDNWHGGTTVGNDLASLPEGVYELAGVQFDVRGIVQVSGRNLEQQRPATYPQEVTSIKVERACRKLHFLQGTGWQEEPGKEIGSYVVRYQDGQTTRIPIVYGKDVLDWWTPRGSEPPASEVAWTGSNAAAKGANITLKLYKTTWTNPRSDALIQSLDFVSVNSGSAPFLIAITAE